MRILLTMQWGCVDYDNIKTANGKIYASFQDASIEIGSGNQLKRLFVTMLFMNAMVKPDVVWTAHLEIVSRWNCLPKEKTTKYSNDLKELCLIEIEKLPNSNGRSLKDYTSLPCPDSSNLISITKKIVLNIASSGIASLLLPGGRTTHSTFSIPLLMTEESTRNIAQVNEIKNFVDWILQIGNNGMDSYDKGEGGIEIPTDILALDIDKPFLSLVDFLYSNILENLNIPNFFEERAILAPALETVDEVNEFMFLDTSFHFDEDYEIQGDWFTPKFLNEIKCLGIPNGLCNVLTGKNYGDTIFISRIDLVPSDPSFSFKFQLQQFPLSLCFAMTTNQSQGQSLSKVGLYLPRPAFTHGQLYVVVSRVKSKEDLKMLILDEERKVCTSTKNVVYKEVFVNL
ncbi:hypothetical protein D0Y65_009822, partial [Glycine soja]